MYFCKTIKNNIIDQGEFNRIIYSNSLMSLNVVYIQLDFINASIMKNGEKLKLNYNISENIDMINKIKDIESKILSKKNTNKLVQSKIYDCIFSRKITLFKNDKDILLKISGIWETDAYIGLSFKFIHRH